MRVLESEPLVLTTVSDASYKGVTKYVRIFIIGIINTNFPFLVALNDLISVCGVMLSYNSILSSFSLFVYYVVLLLFSFTTLQLCSVLQFMLVFFQLW